MKSAIIGIGVIGKLHTNTLLSIGMPPCAICDIDEARTALFPDLAHYTDYKEMLLTEKPEVVHICTPHYLHKEMILFALKHGINVLCEKPLCIREDDLDEIIAAADASEAMLGVCHQNRYRKSNVYLKERLAGQKIITAHADVVWHRDSSYYDGADWRGTREHEGGGVLINQAIHTVDLLQWLCGMPHSVTALIDNLTLKDRIEVEDTAALLFSGDIDFSLFATNGGTKDFPVEVVVRTEDEVVRAFGPTVVDNDGIHVFDEPPVQFGKSCYGPGHRTLFRHFYECVEKGEPYPIDAREGAKAVRMVLAAYRSHGQKIGI